jgi:uncharacterized protein (DUF849 family)
MQKVIISCAVTGSVHTPSMSPFLPQTPDQIAEQAIGAANAGAAILHLHARDPGNGRPSPSADIFMQFLPRIHAETDAVINITTGGAPGMTMDERLQAAERVQPELASLNMGTMCFGLFPMAERPRDWKHDWEPAFLRATEDIVFKNTFADIRQVIERLSVGGTRFEFECYDLSHLYNLAHFVDRGLVKPPFLVQSVMGILGGIGAAPESLFYMRQTADRLFGKDYIWSLFGAGRAQMPLITMGAIMGSSVRVGLEDNLYLAAGQLAQTNAEQVQKICRILVELGLPIATADEARQMLGLKGKEKTRL